MTKNLAISLAASAAVFLVLTSAWLWSGIGAKVVVDCDLRASGLVNCDVTNHGWSPASGAVVLTLTSQHFSDPDHGLVKVGRLWPGGTFKIQDAAPFFRSPTEHCASRGANDGINDWRKRCSFRATFE